MNVGDRAWCERKMGVGTELENVRTEQGIEFKFKAEAGEQSLDT